MTDPCFNSTNRHRRPNPELETFTLTCDFVIREVVREDGSSSGTNVRACCVSAVLLFDCLIVSVVVTKVRVASCLIV